MEGIRSPLEFVERVYQDMESHLPTLAKAQGRVRRWAKSFGGAEFAGIFKFPERATPDWKALLEATAADVAEHRARRPVILVWDELPLMLQKICENHDDRMTMDLLDTLRGLRRTHSGIRMLFTGSIGMHHIAGRLHAAGHMNDATNDMRKVEVPELEAEAAAHLTRELLLGQGLVAHDLAGTVAAVVRDTDAIPFYIHHVVAALSTRGATASPALAAAVVEAALAGAQDAWDLEHYRERLDEYYGKDRLPVVLQILDEVAGAAGPLSLPEIEQRVAGSLSPDRTDYTRRVVTGDLEALRALLVLLQRDHYLQLDAVSGRYRYRFPLIRRWWRLQRGLLP